MPPPRYLLREYALRRLLGDMKPGRFLEVGYGAGQMLASLAAWGFSGVGYDSSPQARAAAAALLAARGVTSVELRDHLPAGELFDYVFLFEVLGYFEDPAGELRRLRSLLRPGGVIIFSFVRDRAGYDPRVVGQMKTFSAAGIDALLSAAGLRARVKWNYGFPLANLMRPAMNAVHLARRRGKESAEETRLTGLGHTAPALRLLGLAVNRLTIRPWGALQMLFRDTDLGNGYLVAAEPS
ncbi:MAG TPA: class I SAM-dependent methyltransferase [Myxococcales bacterium]|nr:class I SAM-dependent methyltransferase [Myxococcales bacterium]